MIEPDPISDIERQCEAAGLSISDVLERAKVAHTTWWRWKGGKFEPRPATLRRIRDAISSRSEAA